MATSNTPNGSPMDVHTSSPDNQPILLTSSDTLPPCPVISTASSSTVIETTDDSEKKNMAAANIDGKVTSPSSAQDKRKWDQLADGSSPNNVRKAAMHDHSNRSPCPSINYDDENQDNDDFLSSLWMGKKPGRKPMTDEDPSDDEDPKVKRKAQNRAAQRAFRERKERYVKDLEVKLKQVQDTHTMATNLLFHENHQLRSIVHRLETENMALKGIHLQQGSALQQQQQLLATNAPFTPIISPPSTSSSLPTIATVPIYNHRHSQDLLRLSSLVNHSPPLNTTSNVGATHPPNQQLQQPQKYTFSVSTPATLRSRHKKQHSSSTSPPLAPKPQRSPVELVRLYPHEHSTMQSTTAESSKLTVETPETTSAHLSPSSPVSSTIPASSSAQTPTAFTDNEQQQEDEEGYNNVFDLLLSSEHFFDTTDAFRDTPGQQQYSHPLDSTSPSSCSSSSFDTTSDYDTTRRSSTIASAHEIWDGLDQHASFQHYSPDELLKSIANSTRIDPVLIKDCLG